MGTLNIFQKHIFGIVFLDFMDLWIFGFLEIVDFWINGFLEYWIIGLLDYWIIGFWDIWISYRESGPAISVVVGLPCYNTLYPIWRCLSQHPGPHLCMRVLGYSYTPQ